MRARENKPLADASGYKKGDAIACSKRGDGQLSRVWVTSHSPQRQQGIFPRKIQVASGSQRMMFLYGALQDVLRRIFVVSKLVFGQILNVMSAERT
jgi:hypothetical protein